MPSTVPHADEPFMRGGLDPSTKTAGGPPQIELTCGAFETGVIAPGAGTTAGPRRKDCMTSTTVIRPKLQWQQIAPARASMRPAPLLFVLDEPTASHGRAERARHRRAVHAAGPGDRRAR